ncbi:hypothetical protein F7725_023161 [Dissostichus mawsoni]|uniref:Secreted protein n=1 Tax=Dissostichus mawsoni TaxID=36200 RepID=A0A7J5Z0C2_DISMA|nr:hypothetical protein F7725_023161 [Dissostichus mawsoni]
MHFLSALGLCSATCVCPETCGAKRSAERSFCGESGVCVGKRASEERGGGGAMKAALTKLSRPKQVCSQDCSSDKSPTTVRDKARPGRLQGIRPRLELGLWSWAEARLDVDQSGESCKFRIPTRHFPSSVKFVLTPCLSFSLSLLQAVRWVLTSASGAKKCDQPVKSRTDRPAIVAAS